MRYFFLLILSVSVPYLSHAQLPHKLLVGDDVPILPLDKWIKGGPLNPYEKGKVYLFDFWAVWCGPCIATMGHLSELQKKYKKEGLEIIGATSADAWGNSYEKVIEFLHSKGLSYDYNFAWLPDSYSDDHKYKAVIYSPWLIAAYDSSSWALPQVFLIDRQGKMAFIGDGYSLTEDFIKKVLDNKQDLAYERRKYIAESEIENKTQDFLAYLKEKKFHDALDLGNNILHNENLTAHALLAICDYIYNKDLVGDNRSLLDFGLEAAKKGVEITDSKAPSQWAVLAKAYSVNGNKEMAVSTIKSAIHLADGDFKEALQKDLQVYEGSTTPVNK